MSIAEKLAKIAENEQAVFEAGKKSEYDTFWDVYQENGNMTYYAYAFAGVGWTQSVFKPKYNIEPVTPTSMFSSSRIVDIRPQTIGVDVDFSKCTSFYYLCSNSTIKRRKSNYAGNGFGGVCG